MGMNSKSINSQTKPPCFAKISHLLKDFGAISGLMLNPSKSKAISLGSWRNNEAKPFSFTWSKEPERARGIFISYDIEGNYNKRVLL